VSHLVDAVRQRPHQLPGVAASSGRRRRDDRVAGGGRRLRPVGDAVRRAGGLLHGSAGAETLPSRRQVASAGQSTRRLPSAVARRAAASFRARRRLSRRQVTYSPALPICTVSQKNVPPFYILNNSAKNKPILRIFSCSDSEEISRRKSVSTPPRPNNVAALL